VLDGGLPGSSCTIRKFVVYFFLKKIRLYESDFELTKPLTSKLQNANEQLTSNKENIKLQKNKKYS
jgi:hypothetical protein